MTFFVSFSQLPAVKKTQKTVQLWRHEGRSYFVSATEILTIYNYFNNPQTSRPGWNSIGRWKFHLDYLSIYLITLIRSSLDVLSFNQYIWCAEFRFTCLIKISLWKFADPIYEPAIWHIPLGITGQVARF